MKYYTNEGCDNMSKANEAEYKLHNYYGDFRGTYPTRTEVQKAKRQFENDYPLGKPYSIIRKKI
ncbi:MAG: hypothetical protein Unbinned2691contig1000_31 [Prokaryotic dsDNA virus sp.]|nr:MAG: hypothetical protein Unbinned2691contig1000_31 [Prokaryotic dsDNA virus sp.]